MTDDILTFETIKQIDREEQNSPKTTKLPDRFFEKLQAYLDAKAKILKEKSDPATSMEFQNTKRILQRILEIRERKLVTQALYSVRTGLPAENLTPEEKDFFDKLLVQLKDFRISVERAMEPKKAEKPVKIVNFLEDTEAFVGPDAESYGPFKQGDVATIPVPNALILIDTKKASEIKPENI